MSRNLAQRFIILAAAILAGLSILEIARYFFLAQAPPWLYFLVIVAIILLVAGLSALVEARPAKSEHPVSTSEQKRFEAELFQLNQELFSRAQEHSSELSRLNTELQLQMAMHKQAEMIAHANEIRFRNMADNIQEGLAIIENDHLVYVNARACEIFGDCPEQDLKSWILKYAAPEEQERLREILKNVDNGGGYPQELEYWIVSQDGSRRCIREHYANSTSEGVTRTFIVTSDITEAVQAYQILENAVSDRTRELSTVLNISHKIASTLELKPLLHLILEQIQTIIPFRGAAIFTLEEDKLHVIAYQVPGLPNQNHPIYLDLKHSGLYNQVIESKKVVLIDDIKGDTPLLRILVGESANPQVLTFEHARSWIGIPMIVRDRVTGLLGLTHSQPGYYRKRHGRLAITIANQIAVAIENARLYEQAQFLGVLEERHRIARELHDSATQLLYGIMLYCTATSRSIKSKNYTMVEQNLREIKDNALQALQEMRLLILELDPPLLQKEGLVAALQASLEAIETRTGLETELKTEAIKRLPRTVETEMYRIALEALNNLVRYARAKKVSVTLQAKKGGVSMEIRDNGVGFDLAIARESSGMGLHNMEQRARQIGGSLKISSAPGEGTCITIFAPVAESWGEPI